MQRVVFFLLMVGLLAVFYFYQQRTIRSTIGVQPDVPEDQLIAIEGVLSNEDRMMSFDLNADTLDQYLSEENPFYAGGFKPELTDFGTLTPASNEVLEQYTIYEFIEQNEFTRLGADASILEYSRADRIGDAAARMSGQYIGELVLQDIKAKFAIQLVPVGGDGLVYEGQWSFAVESVLRFRRIPVQPHWLNPYLPTAWADDQAFRMLIPRGAIVGSGLTSMPLGPGVAAQGFTGYELRGRRSEAGALDGEVYAIGRVEKLGEPWNLAEAVGTFELRPDTGDPLP